jgi:putative serine protease PepD
MLRGGRMTNIWRRVALGVAVAVVLVGTYILGGYTFGKIVPSSVSLYNQAQVTSLYSSASQATVEIKVTLQPGLNGRSSQEAEGSGFLVDTNGDIVTNDHVVDGATGIQVVLNSGKTVSGKLAGTDQTADLAVIAIDPSSVSNVTPLKLADSNAVKIGQLVVAIGSPYGQMNSGSIGVISGVNRSIDDGNVSLMTGMLQTDALVEPGNSGGPLINDQGQVIGVITASDSSQDQAGFGFAIPSNTVANELTSLINGQTVAHPWLGITATTLDSHQAGQAGISQGVHVVQVVAGSPAAQAGIKAGDIITAIDGKSLTSVDDLTSYLNTKQVGDKVSLTLVSASGKSETLQVTLGAKPANT